MANRSFADATERAAYAISPEEAANRASFLQADTGVTYVAKRGGAGLENWLIAYDVDTAAAVLETQRIKKVSKTVLFSDLTDADGSQTLAFASALPASAVVLGAAINVTAAFTDGAAGVFTADVGVNAGDLDALVDGASLAAIARVGSPFGVGPAGFYGAITPAITVLATVNLNTATAGALTCDVYYFEGANI